MIDDIVLTPGHFLVEAHLFVSVARLARLPATSRLIEASCDPTPEERACAVTCLIGEVRALSRIVQIVLSSSVIIEIVLDDGGA